jgi:hypothetical protein
MRRVLIWCACLLFLTGGVSWAATGSRPDVTLFAALDRAHAARPDSMLFGNRSVGPGGGRASTGSLEAFRFPDGVSGTARSISLFVAVDSTAKSLVAGLYSNDHGAPGTMLGSGAVSAPRSGAWNAIKIKPAAVTAGRAYWVLVLAKRGTLVFRGRSGRCRTGSLSAAHVNAMSSPPRNFHRMSVCAISAFVSGSRSVSSNAGTSQTNGSSPPSGGTSQTNGSNPPVGGATQPPSGTTSPTGGPPTNPAPVIGSLPTISGTAQQGDVLTAGHGSWTNNPTSYAYQWQRCVAAVCTNISGATGTSYVLQSSDVGDTVVVVVIASNAGGSSAPAVSAPTVTVTAASSSGVSPLHVSGNQLLNASGQSVFLHGADRSGTEYSCIHNTGFFDGTGTSLSQEDAQITGMASWHVNSEFIGLNEDCWLGINGAPAAYSNSSASPPTPGCSAAQCPYANAIENLVQTDEANGIYPVIGFFWGGPGTTQATSLQTDPLSDNDHAPLFWEEVTNFFKNDPYVIFRLMEEPNINGGLGGWQCWSQGDVSYGTSSDNTPPTPPSPTGSPGKCQSAGYTSYPAVGMQSLVNIIRGAGATNIIQIPGMGYANLLACGTTTSPVTCGFLDSTDGVRVQDTLASPQLMADVDVYPDGNACGSTACYNATYKPVAQVMPLDSGETGPGSTTTLVDQFLAWMDQNANGYYAWAWDSWGEGLVSSYTSSTPAYPWGVDYYDHINNITPPPPPQPTDGITFPNYETQGGNMLNSTVNLGSSSSPINAGDDLFAVFTAEAYGNNASTINTVSDNVNGAWTEVANTGSQCTAAVQSNCGTSASGQNLDYEVFELPNSKAAPNGLTLTTTGTPGSGGGGSSAVIVDARGVASIVSSAFDSTIQTSGSPFTGPTLPNVAANDVVLGFWGAYSGNGAIDFSSTATPWNTSYAYWTSAVGTVAAGMDWTQPTTTGPVTPQISSNGADVYYGGGIDLKP